MLDIGTGWAMLIAKKTITGHKVFGPNSDNVCFKVIHAFLLNSEYSKLLM